MVKKKSPIVPLTFVVIGVAVAFVVNSRLRPVDPKQAEADAHANQQPPEGATRKQDKTQDVHAAMMASGQEAGPGRKMMPKTKMPGGPPGGDLMVGRKPVQYKPTPSATATNAEWYKND